MSLIAWRSAWPAGRIVNSFILSPPALSCHRWEPFAGKTAVHVDFDSVGFDVAAFSQVYDHVPVEAGLIVVAAFGVSRAQGEMAGAADFFVEEGVAGVALNFVVGADGAFAKRARAGVH